MKVIRATVLCENSVFFSEGAIAEHGWSVFIETEEGNLLLDTGQGLGIINNARVLDKDLSTLKGIVLSHHHYDHTGGLKSVLESIKRRIPVYAHPHLFKESYVTRRGKIRYIGIPYNQALLETLGADLSFSSEAREIMPNIFLTGEVPRLTPYEKGDQDLVVKEEGTFIKDNIIDDQSLVIKTGQGLFIVLGCAHSGIINTLEYARKITGEEKIHTVIGGTHLGPVSEEQKTASIQALKRFNITRLGVSHCTGLPTSARLAHEFGEKFLYCNVGTVIEA